MKAACLSSGEGESWSSDGIAYSPDASGVKVDLPDNMQPITLEKRRRRFSSIWNRLHWWRISKRIASWFKHWWQENNFPQNKTRLQPVCKCTLQIKTRISIIYPIFIQQVSAILPVFFLPLHFPLQPWTKTIKVTLHPIHTHVYLSCVDVLMCTLGSFWVGYSRTQGRFNDNNQVNTVFTLRYCDISHNNNNNNNTIICLYYMLQ